MEPHSVAKKLRSKYLGVGEIVPQLLSSLRDSRVLSAPPSAEALGYLLLSLRDGHIFVPPPAPNASTTRPAPPEI